MSTIALIALLLAFGSPAAPLEAQNAKGKAARTIEITGTDDMKFSVTKITAKPGEQIRIVLKSVGKMPKTVMAHNVVVLKPKVDPKAFANAAMMSRATGFIPAARKADIVAATPLAGNGETVEVTFTVPSVVDDYPYICSFPGHAAAGMVGVLSVQK